MVPELKENVKSLEQVRATQSDQISDKSQHECTPKLNQGCEILEMNKFRGTQAQNLPKTESS